MHAFDPVSIPEPNEEKLEKEAEIDAIAKPTSHSPGADVIISHATQSEKNHSRIILVTNAVIT